MGQYYNVVTMDKNGEIKAYNRDLDGQYTLAKLMEHSWWFNEFVSTITKVLYHNPMRIAWVGDYADDADNIENIFKFDEIFKAAWGKDAEKNLLGLKKDMLLLDGKFLVNHTDKTYIDCDQYRSLSDPDNTGWIIHPLPLLTCVGNGLGGGDYYGYDEGDVGSWCMREISVEDESPVGYEKLSGLFFYEEGLAAIVNN